MNQPFFRKVWGGATGWLDRSRKLGWFDLIFILAVAALVVGLWQLGVHLNERPPHSSEEAVRSIDLSPWALPLYTFYSLMRGVIAYVLSLLFTLVYGYWAAKDRVAQRVLIPLLDILQSIPVLGFAPFLLLVFVKAFPTNNIGLELAVIISIFTGQAWNMTFSFYQSVRSVPSDMHEAATVYRFSWWRRFKCVELPFSTIGLIWNSMMSFAGGWFFLATVEGLDIGTSHYWPPGIGSYIKKASTGDAGTGAPWLGRSRDDSHDRGPGSAAVAAGRGLGAEVPRRGRRGAGGDDFLVPRSAAPVAAGELPAEGTGRRAAAPRGRQDRGVAPGPGGPDARLAAHGLGVAGAVRRAGGRADLRRLVPPAADPSVPCGLLGRPPDGRPLDAASRAGRRGDRHPLGAPGGPADRPVAPAVARVAAGRSGAGVVPGADRLSRWRSWGSKRRRRRCGEGATTRRCWNGAASS